MDIGHTRWTSNSVRDELQETWENGRLYMFVQTSAIQSSSLNRPLKTPAIGKSKKGRLSHVALPGNGWTVLSQRPCVMTAMAPRLCASQRAGSLGRGAGLCGQWTSLHSTIHSTIQTFSHSMPLPKPFLPW